MPSWVRVCGSAPIAPRVCHLLCSSARSAPSTSLLALASRVGDTLNTLTKNSYGHLPRYRPNDEQTSGVQTEERNNRCRLGSRYLVVVLEVDSSAVVGVETVGGGVVEAVSSSESLGPPLCVDVCRRLANAQQPEVYLEPKWLRFRKECFSRTLLTPIYCVDASSSRAQRRCRTFIAVAQS